MKSISILGSTGSIGRNTLRVVEHLADFRVVALAAGKNMQIFADQIERFKPDLVSCSNDESAVTLEKAIHGRKINTPRIEIGEFGLVAVATHPEAETVVSATVGAVGFVPTLRAIESGKRVALANKETLVMAGELMTDAAKQSGAEILPVDSEHNAIHQCIRGEEPSEVKRIILTASGGPFRNSSKEQIEAATVRQALDHPNWDMGDKITIDSATLMNKGLEVIEAKWLFGFDADRISVVVHPQSIIHSMIEMRDGSIKAQLGVTDMKHAIQYALTYPERRQNCLPPLDLAVLGRLDFEEPDLDRFPCLELAFRALKAGGTMPTVLNAANEVAVSEFLAGRIRLTDIARLNASVMSIHTAEPVLDLETILRVDNWARTTTKEMLLANADTAAIAV